MCVFLVSSTSCFDQRGTSSLMRVNSWKLNSARCSIRQPAARIRRRHEQFLLYAYTYSCFFWRHALMFLWNLHLEHVCIRSWHVYIRSWHMYIRNWPCLHSQLTMSAFAIDMCTFAINHVCIRNWPCVHSQLTPRLSTPGGSGRALSLARPELLLTVSRCFPHVCKQPDGRIFE